MFINFPYTDLYALNLDWILQQITAMKADNQTIEDLINSLGTVVNTVNGQSGNVTITDSMVAGAKLESVYVAPNTPWSNIVGNITNLYNSGIRIIVCGNNDRDLYVLKKSGGNIDYARYNPLGSASTFVESINGQSGAVAITDSMINATDINIFEWADPNETINDYTSANLLTLYDNGIRLIFTQNSFGDYANMYALYKSGGAVSYVAYEPTSAVAGVLSINGLSGAVTLTAGDLGAVPVTTQVNGNPLSSDVVLTAGDVGAVPTSRTVNNKALSTNISLTASDVGAVPTTRTVNNKALSTNISLTASDVGAVPPTRTVNYKALSSDIVLDGSDIESNIMASGNSVADDLTALKNRHILSNATTLTGSNYNIYFYTLERICFMRGSITKQTGVNDTTITGMPAPETNFVMLARDNSTGKRNDISIAMGGDNTTAILSFYNANHTPTDGKTYSFQTTYIRKM